MANTINAYDADVRIPQFLGLKQYGDLMNGNPVYADHAANMNTKGGTLMPMAKPEALQGSLDYAIETLMMVNNRWGDTSVLLVAASAGFIYVRGEDENAWRQVDMPEGIEQFSSSEWSWVDYEINLEDGSTHDVIIFTNLYDGMFMLDGTDLTMKAVRTPYRFRVIERRSERIWGAGCRSEDGIDEPDLLCYSAPYDPEDWCQRDPSYPDDPEHWKKPGQPEDGGGEIREPSWDGDGFTSLKAFGDQLIAFKRTRVWRVLGTDPGVYEFKEQYGGGSYVPQSVAVDSQRIYMLSRNGIMCYDGSAVEPFGKEYAYDVWKRLNHAHIDEAAGCVWQDKYYIAVPLDDSDTNNAVVTYDMHDGTWLMRTDLQVESWLPAENALYFTTVDDPFSVHKYIENAWESGEAIAQEQFWVSPWNDLGYPFKNKGPFQFYFTPEVRDRPVEFEITIDTDKRSRSKTVRVYPITGYEERMHYEAKTIRIPFAGNGRRFRVTIKADGGAAWRICGGVVIRVDQETED